MQNKHHEKESDIDTQSWYFWTKDKVGDGVISVLDEIKFWGEVVSEYMGWDESSAKRIAADYKEEIREQLQEVDDISKQVRS
jgi:hypothetical protein